MADLKAVGDRIFKSPRGRLLYLVVALLGAGLFSYASCTTYVRPNEYGIKQITYGGDKGIKPEIYTTGLHWVTAGTERMHRFPADIQTLDLTAEASEQGPDARRRGALNIQTSEGYQVTVDVSVLYRITDAYKVITRVGPGKMYEDALVIPRSEQILRRELGALDAEQFYDVKLRTARSDEALKQLNEELAPSGIEVTHVFVRRYTYDQRYQHAIEARKIQDQTVFKNKAEAEMATANAEKDRIVAVGEAQIQVELARGEAEKKKLEAEAELYRRKQEAAGELEVKLAEAEGTRQENEALRGAGSEALVGLKMAEVLKGTQVIVLPSDGPNGTNPLDLKNALRRFDVTE